MSQMPMHSQFAVYRLFAMVTAHVILAVLQLVAGETIVDESRGFTLTLPDGFVPNPELVRAAPGIAHGFILGNPTDDEPDIILFLKKMDGVIGQERIKPENMPASFQGQVFTTRWQGFDVNAFEVPEQINEINTITYNVQIPLKGAAIQVMLFGPADRKSELKTLLPEIIQGLEGESNWTQSWAPFHSLASSPHYSNILLGCAAAFILGGLVVLWLISRKAPKGTVLGIAAVIYCLGSAPLAEVPVREVVLLSGVAQMLGFAGCILGIVDLVRTRKPKNQEDPDQVVTAQLSEPTENNEE